ncbi:hypothetical protein QP411_09275 [Pseudoglutamicibacter cumminsii]|uniref:hypothetical protein n=1 Tax=Pseudoglutamicibacter cumminsii TaxID=156979 RepID=UPI002552219A|nr:hypothetical protein [Pseudoglutamicibacter cumminsii]MDK7084088.1 hypothetical protein [Pseudoglutamicibacter cumminsii]
MKNMETLTQEQLRLGRLKYSPIDYLAKLKEGLTESEFAEKYRLLKYRCPKGCSLGAVYETPLGRIITNRGLLYAIPLTPQAELIAECLDQHKRLLYSFDRLDREAKEAGHPRIFIAGKYSALSATKSVEIELATTRSEGNTPDPFKQRWYEAAKKTVQKLEAHLKAKRLHTESAALWFDEFFMAGEWLCLAHKVEPCLTRDDISADLDRAKQTKQKTIILDPPSPDEMSMNDRARGHINNSYTRHLVRKEEEQSHFYSHFLPFSEPAYQAVKDEALRLAKEKRTRTTDTDAT